MKILCFGEILWDHIGKEYHLGGAPLNFAAHSARLGSESYLISAVGRDDLGSKALGEAGKIGVKTDYVTPVDHPTGVVEVSMDGGIPSYEIVTGTAWDNILMTEESQEEILNAQWDLFYMGTLAQRSRTNGDLLHKTLLNRLKAKSVFFDVNLRQDYYDRDVMERSLEHTTILKLNDEELPVTGALLYEEEMPPASLFARLRSDYPRLEMMILTKGADGADIINSQGLRHYPIESGVVPVDTVGAGDSYSGAFCYAWHHTGDLDRSARFAQDVADRVVSQAGALPDYGREILERARKLGGTEKG